MIPRASIVFVDAQTAQEHVLAPRGSRDMISRTALFMTTGVIMISDSDYTLFVVIIIMNDYDYMACVVIIIMNKWLA